MEQWQPLNLKEIGPDLWTTLVKDHPDCVKPVLAHEITFHKANLGLVGKSFNRWFKRTDDIYDYLKSSSNYDMDKDEGFFITEGKIIALDIELLVTDLKKKDKPIPAVFDQMAKCGQVVCLELKEVMTQKETSWFELFYHRK